jgi:hypothetical protein
VRCFCSRTSPPIPKWLERSRKTPAWGPTLPAASQSDVIRYATAPSEPFLSPHHPPRLDSSPLHPSIHSSVHLFIINSLVFTSPSTCLLLLLFFFSLSLSPPPPSISSTPIPTTIHSRNKRVKSHVMCNDAANAFTNTAAPNAHVLRTSRVRTVPGESAHRLRLRSASVSCLPGVCQLLCRKTTALNRRHTPGDQEHASLHMHTP